MIDAQSEACMMATNFAKLTSQSFSFLVVSKWHGVILIMKLNIDDEWNLQGFSEKRICRDAGWFPWWRMEGKPLQNGGGGGVVTSKDPWWSSVLTNGRIFLLLSKCHSCYRPRRAGEHNCKSVCGCILHAALNVLRLVVVRKGGQEILRLTNNCAFVFDACLCYHYLTGPFGYPSAHALCAVSSAVAVTCVQQLVRRSTLCVKLVADCKICICDVRWARGQFVRQAGKEEGRMVLLFSIVCW